MVPSTALEKAGSNGRAVTDSFDQLPEDAPEFTAAARVPVPGYSPQMQQILETYSWEEVESIGDTDCHPEHLLLALIRMPESNAARLLSNAQIDLEGLRASVVEHIYQRQMTPKKAPPSGPFQESEVRSHIFVPDGFLVATLVSYREHSMIDEKRASAIVEMLEKALAAVKNESDVAAASDVIVDTLDQVTLPLFSKEFIEETGLTAEDLKEDMESRSEFRKHLSIALLELVATEGPENARRRVVELFETLLKRFKEAQPGFWVI